MSFETGPYVQAACFCENIIVDQAGRVSLINIIDTITHTVQGPDAPEDLPEMSFGLKLAIMMKSGNAIGRSDIRIEPEGPDGIHKDPLVFSIQLDGEERGANFLSDFNFTITSEGLHWFHIYVGGRHATAIPLRVRYNRMLVTPISSS